MSLPSEGGVDEVFPAGTFAEHFGEPGIGADALSLLEDIGDGDEPDAVLCSAMTGIEEVAGFAEAFVRALFHEVDGIPSEVSARRGSGLVDELVHEAVGSVHGAECFDAAKDEGCAA